MASSIPWLSRELAALKSLWQLLPDGLFNNSRPGESNQGSGFGKVQVSQHGEAGGNATGGRIGQNRNVGDAGFIETGLTRR